MNKRKIAHKAGSINLLSSEERLKAFERSMELINSVSISHEAFAFSNESECYSGGLDGE